MKEVVNTELCGSFKKKHPYLGKISNLTNIFQYFSNGLKPPAREYVNLNLKDIKTID